MSPALHHLRFCTRAVLTSLAGLTCSCALLLLACALVAMVDPARLNPVLSLILSAVVLSCIAWGTAGGIENGLGSREALPSLPIGDRARGVLEGLAWLPAWIVLASAMGVFVVLAKADPPTSIVIAILLSVPLLILGAFLPRLGSATVLPVGVISMIEATCIQLGAAESVPAAALTAVVLTPIVIAFGPRIRRLPPLSWPAREGPRWRPARAPTQRLALDAVNGLGRGMARLLPFAVFPPLGMALLIASGHPLTDGPPGPAIAWTGALGACALVGGLVFCPFGRSGVTVGPEGVQAELSGEYGRAWSVLPVARRAVVLAVYLPAHGAALFAVTATHVVGRVGCVGWVQPPSPGFVAGLYAYAVLTPALITVGQLGTVGLRRLAGGVCLVVLGLTFVVSVTRDPVLMALTIGAASVSGLALPALLLRRP